MDIRSWVFQLLGAASLAGAWAQTEHPVLAKGYGIDHVVVGVRDLEASKTLFRERLGFKLPPLGGGGGRHPGGTANASAYFANASYLELLAVADREQLAASRPRTLDFLERHEGGYLLALSTSSALQTADALRSLGLRAGEPVAGTIARPGDSKPAETKWWTVELREAAPLFFIQYRNTDYADIFHNWSEGYAQARTAAYFRQPNGVLGLSAAWIVVRDLATEAGPYEKLLGGGERVFTHAGLAARVREFRLLRQRVFLLQPSDAQGPAGRFLAERGGGLMGISVEVADLAATAALLRVSPSTGVGLVGSQALLLPGSQAAGLWIEFHAALP